MRTDSLLECDYSNSNVMLGNLNGRGNCVIFLNPRQYAYLDNELKKNKSSIEYEAKTRNIRFIIKR